MAILPIGAFRPQWFMGEVHMSPEEAVRAHLQLGARISIASHFGTFRLADDGEDEPVQRLREAMCHAELNEKEFWVLACGEGRNLPAESASDDPQETGDLTRGKFQFEKRACSSRDGGLQVRM